MVFRRESEGDQEPTITSLSSNARVWVGYLRQASGR